MSKWPLPLACLLVTGCLRAPDEADPSAAAPAETTANPVVTAPVGTSTPPVHSTRSPSLASTSAAEEFTRALSGARLTADAEMRSALIAAVFKTRANDDLAAAHRAAAELTDPEERLSAHEGVLAAALTRDVREAVTWVLGLQPPALSSVLLDQALADWVGVDARAAGAHVASLGESDYRTVLAGEVAGAWVVRDAVAATTWSASLTDQEAREEALRRIVVATLATKDPRQAAELALTVPGEGDRATTLELAVNSWWERDPDGLATWTGKIADETTRTQVTRLLEAQREGTQEGRLDQ